MRLIAIGVALLSSVSVAPQATPAPVGAVAAPDAAADAIAELLANDATVLAQTRRLLQTQLPAALESDPDMQAMEKQWPGVTAEFIKLVEPIITASLTSQLPAYRRDVAAVFARRMTPDELKTTYDFYASPAGQRLMASALTGVDVTDMLRKQIKAGESAEVSGADISNAVRPGAQSALNALDTDDQMRLMAFTMTSAGRKMEAINPQLMQLAARLNNERSPDAEKQIGQVVEQLIAQRMAAGGK
jgi:hypothetical protein